MSYEIFFCLGLLGGGCEHFTHVQNWDYPHNDMLHTVVNDYDTCCSLCWHQTSCMGFAYSPSMKVCWIKTKMTETIGHRHPDRNCGYLSMSLQIFCRPSDELIFVVGACMEEKRVENLDYPDNNLFEGELIGSLPAPDWKTCCGLCLRQSLCQAYTFSIPTQQCWLKTKAGNGTFDANKISGNRT